MKRILCLFAGLLCLAISANAWAQATAQINGSVKDQTGAVLPGAEIRVTQTETGISRDAISDETGSYTLANLPVGPYRVEVGLPGFKTFVQTGLVLGANANPTVNAILEVGQVSEQVEVQANATQVETRSLSVRQVIENEQILELPLNGRNATELITLAGGAVASGGNSSSRSLAGGVGVSVAGLQGASVAYTLDGAMHNNPYDNLNLAIPFPDALQEFSVQTGSQNAQNGMLSGAQVGAVTKSGTNRFSGVIFDFVRNDRFKARGYFDTTKGSQRRNQFGGTLGGPIIRNKLFFFGGFQGTLNNQNPDEEEVIVPTARMLAGDFTEIVKVYTDPVAQVGGCRTTPVNNTGTGATPGLLKGGFVDNKIDPSGFSKTSLNLLAKLPKPIDECGRVRYQTREESNNQQYVGKIDYQMSASNSIFGRVMFIPSNEKVPFSFTPDNFLNVGNAGFDNFGQLYTIGDTILISPNTVNAFRLALNRTAIHRVGPDFFSIPDLGVKAFSYLPKHSQLSVNGSFSLGGGTESEATFRTTAYQLSDDVNLVRGVHQMAFGANIAHWRSNSYANVRSTGVYSFTLDNTGLGMGDFLLGKLNSLRQAAPNQLTISQWYIGLYAQDAWRVTPRLTVNVGLRWEPYFPQQQRDGHIYNFDYERFTAGVKTSVFNNAPPGFYYPTDPGFPSKAGVYKNWKALGPRMGLGWDPTGEGKMSVRAGYGLTYDFVNAQYHLNTNIAPPWGNDITITPPSFEDPWANYPGGNPFPFSFDKNSPFGQFGVFLSMPYDIATTYVQSWNLAIQRQMPANIFLSVAYNGNGTRHLWSTWPMNPAVYYSGSNCSLPNGRFLSGTCSATQADNVNQRRLLSLQNYAVGQYIGALDSYDDGGTSSYHGLVITANRRATRNLNLSGNYTWSHCIGNDGTAGGAPNINTGTVYNLVVDGVSRPVDRRADRANCGSDRRHVVNTTAVVETPQFSNRVVRYLASGWRVSNIYRRSSGSFISVSAGADVARVGGNTGQQRATQLSGDVYASGRPRGPRSVYLNPGVFAQPAIGTFAPNKGLRNIEGPYTWQWDASISRIFNFRETQRIEVRAEAYNVPNSFRPGNPSTNLTNGTFGQLNSSSATRDMQFALKYYF